MLLRSVLQTNGPALVAQFIITMRQAVSELSYPFYGDRRGLSLHVRQMRIDYYGLQTVLCCRTP